MFVGKDMDLSFSIACATGAAPKGVADEAKNSVATGDVCVRPQALRMAGILNHSGLITCFAR